MREMTEFIFMLTHHDVTVKNAIEVFNEVKDTGLRYVGCKDVGLPKPELKKLFRLMKEAGMTTFFEVVTYEEGRHFAGVNLAIEIGADYLIGGMPWFTEKTLTYIKERGVDIKYFPYIGKIEDHPCILKGEVDEIIENGKRAEDLGVDGINLLLYRYTGNQKRLLERATKDLKVPLIVAGSVNSFKKIRELMEHNVWAFTIGSAIFEKKLVPGRSIRDQIRSVLKFVEEGEL